MSDVVTAVIPTSGRRPTVRAAVESALAQRACEVRVVVVVDGATVDTVASLLGSFTVDERVQLRATAPNQRGSNAARNAGIAAADSEWIALLDDDDLWSPDKLAKQFAAVRGNQQDVIVSHRFLARRANHDAVWPRFIPGEDDRHLSEYLFCRRGFFDGDGHLQTSTLFTRREFALRVPFREDLSRHQDHDWLLRSAAAGASIVMLPDILSVYNLPALGGDAIGSRGQWRERFEWASTNRQLFTPRGYAGFLLSYGAFAAALDGDRAAVRFLVRDAYAHGRPRPRDVALAAALTTLSPNLRRNIKAVVRRYPITRMAR